MARKQTPESLTDHLLPLRLHSTGGTQFPDASQPAQTLPALVRLRRTSLLEFGRNRLKGDLGITVVLHTWGQKLDFHPHLHCIVTGGALSPDGKQWRSTKQRKFLFPVRALASLFRGKFLAGLAQMLDAGELHLPDLELKIAANRARWFSLLYTKRWVLYAKRPFGGRSRS
jgi:Putative transposase.